MTENSDIGIKGEKPGFLQFPVQLASAQLGTFTSPCLVNIGDCDSGLTIGLWVKMENSSTSGSNDFKLFWTKRDSSGEDDTEEPYLQIRYSMGTGKEMFFGIPYRSISPCFGVIIFTCVKTCQKCKHLWTIFFVLGEN